MTPQWAMCSDPNLNFPPQLDCESFPWAPFMPSTFRAGDPPPPPGDPFKGWQCQGWRGSSGKVACVDLWQTIVQELSNPDREILWVKVPPHVDVPGNEGADRLSKVGRMSHPLFPTKATPALQVITTPATPKVKKAKHDPLPDAHHTPLLPKILDFSFFVILSLEPAFVPSDSTHALWDALGMQPMPDSPRDNVHSDCSCSTGCSCELHAVGHNGPT